MVEQAHPGGRVWFRQVAGGGEQGSPFLWKFDELRSVGVGVFGAEIGRHGLAWEGGPA